MRKSRHTYTKWHFLEVVCLFPGKTWVQRPTRVTVILSRRIAQGYVQPVLWWCWSCIAAMVMVRVSGIKSRASRKRQEMSGNSEQDDSMGALDVVRDGCL